MSTREREQENPRHAEFSKTAIAAAVLAGLMLMPAPGVRTAAVPLLEPVTTSAANGLAMGAASPAAIRSRAVRVNLYPLPTPGMAARSSEDDVELALFPDVVLTAVFERFETIRGSGTWVGKLDGLPMSAVSLAYRDGILSADINTGRAMYAIRPVFDGDRRGDDAARPLHVVEEMDSSRLLSGPDIADAPLIAEPTPATAPGSSADSGAVIDVMVVFTPTAEARLGGPVAINNQIALVVAGTNAAYARSGITQRLRLVHTALVPYVEPTSGSSVESNRVVLDNLRRGVEGLANVTALRNAHGADLVMLLRQHTVGCGGVGYLSTDGVTYALPTHGYSVVGASCLGTNIFAHELGHNMGALHGWYDEGGTEDLDWPMPFAHGHVDVSTRTITIMSYNSMCGDLGFTCAWLPYFSNPNIEYVPFCSGTNFDCDLLRRWLYPSARLGADAAASTNCRSNVVPVAPCQADNRRALNQTAPMVANYRQSR